ncbi:MAG: hypothetical protein WA013_04965 [Acidovorax sp.]|uniref:hypothetical protein n=1 Tax=Acidovorax soli TaxID=592050 RepID=UPI0026F11E58|nr:hypothetical protein [Acidovorax soli]
MVTVSFSSRMGWRLAKHHTLITQRRQATDRDRTMEQLGLHRADKTWVSPCSQQHNMQSSVHTISLPVQNRQKVKKDLQLVLQVL